MNGSQIKFLSVFTVIIAAFLIWMFYFTPRNSGDIGLLGAIPFGKGGGSCWVGDVQSYPGDGLIAYSDTVSMSNDDLVIIGDSFACGCGNCSFANCLSSLADGRRTINVVRQSFIHPVQDCISMLNKGMFTGGQTVILESVERAFFDRIVTMDLSRSDSLEFRTSNGVKEKQFSSNNFLKWLRLVAGIDNPIYEFDLERDFFSMAGYERKLYVYKDDFWFESSGYYSNEIIEGLNKLKELADSKGVNLLVLIAADKYDCYEPWINDEHTENHRLDEISSLSYVINTKTVLQENIAAGVKDVYKCNNTHWSNVGATIVAEHICDKYLSER